MELSHCWYVTNQYQAQVSKVLNYVLSDVYSDCPHCNAQSRLTVNNFLVIIHHLLWNKNVDSLW